MKTPKVTLPSSPRDCPKAREIEDVIRVVCHKSGLDPDAISCSMIGGRRKQEFGQHGIKLLSLKQDAVAVPVYIGCERECAEGHISSVQVPNARELYSKLMAAFGSRKVHIVDKGRIRQARKHFGEEPERQPVNPHQDSNVSSNGTHHPTSLPEDSPPDTPESSTVATEVVAAVDVAESATQDVDPNSLVSNPGLVHLALLEFATNFRVNEIFGFTRFAQMLEDVGILGQARAYVRVFTRSGFLIRVNPGRPPARYATTQLCHDVAGMDEESALPLIIEHLKRPEKSQPNEDDAPEDEKSNVDVLGRIQALRVNEERFQTLQRQILAKRMDLQKLHKRNFREEEKQISVQITSLQKRLEELNAGLSELAKDRARIGGLDAEIHALVEEAATLENAHAEITKIKALLG